MRLRDKRRRCVVCREPFQSTRQDARTCSNACRQAAYRRALRHRPRPIKARQRLIRERMAAQAAERRVGSVAAAEVREITRGEAAAIISQFEPMPAVVRHCYGIFFDGELGGAVVYGDDYAENWGVWDRYGFSGRIIALLRGACLHWAPPHAASKLIRRSMRLLPARYKVVTATADFALGEVGTVYQAAGFHYVGQMHQRDRLLVSYRGKRMAREVLGASTIRALKALGIRGLKVERIPRRARYFAFRGSARERRELRDAIAHLVKPYPKRPPPAPEYRPLKARLARRTMCFS